MKRVRTHTLGVVHDLLCFEYVVLLNVHPQVLVHNIQDRTCQACLSLNRSEHCLKMYLT